MKPEEICKSGSEFGEQSALFCWANGPATRATFPDFFNPHTRRCKMYATNQNFMDAVKGARAKQIGIQSGVSDIFIPLARHGCHGLYIELKKNPNHPQNVKAVDRKARKGKASDEQTWFGEQVRADGYGWCICEGWEAARDVIIRYLSP